MPDRAASSGLVLDTSRWINLLATGMIEPILDALIIPCHAPEQVVADLRRHPVTGEALAEECFARARQFGRMHVPKS